MAVTSLVVLSAFTLAAQTREGEPHRFLETHAGFTAAELRSMDEGGVVVKVLDTGDAREVAIVGVARIRATTDFYLRMFRDIERFDTAATRAKKISSPPRPEDFATMRIPAADLKSLETCRVDACDVKLGEPTLERFQSEVDWATPNASSVAESILREQALAFAKAYTEEGASALGVYRDKRQPSYIATEFEILLRQSPYVLDYRPELHRYLLDYPAARLEGAEDFLYWGEYDLASKPLLRMSHVTIYPLEEGENASVIIAAKQIFFSHYFVTGLELNVLARDRRSDETAFYLVTVLRERTDGSGGMFGKMLLRTLQEPVRKGLEAYLRSTQSAVETYYRQQ